MVVVPPPLWADRRSERIRFVLRHDSIFGAVPKMMLSVLLFETTARRNVAPSKPSLSSSY
jgi:hypothetical protein